MTDRNVESVLPLTPMQEGMLFHALEAGASGVYFRQSTWALPADLDAVALRDAWRRVVERHAALRTTFVWKGFEHPLQVARRRLELPWREEDWRRVPAAEVAARTAELLRRDREQGFDLERGPLLRFTLLRVDGGHRLVWSYLQLLLDGWSRAMVLGEVMRLYTGLRSGSEPELPASRPFRDYVEWLAARNGTGAAFWSRHLDGFREPLPLPFAPRGAAGGGEAREVRHLLGEAATTALGAAARAAGLTLNTLVLGAWALLVSRATGRRDLVLGVTDSGRPADLAGAERIVGLFINTLPLRLDADPSRRTAEWLAALQERQAELRQHGHTPLVAIQAMSAVPAALPLFESIYVFENYPVDAERDADLEDGAADAGGEAVRIVQSYTRTHYPLNLLVTPARRLGLVCRFDSGRLAEDAARRLLAHLATVLVHLPDHLDSPLGAVPWLTPAQRHQALHEWNDAERLLDAPAGDTLDALFRRQARRTPEAAAVRCGGDVLTYAALDAASDRLAARLRRAAAAAGGEPRIGVCLPPGPDLAVAVLGVLKSGGAWVPLDPEHPTPRLAFLARDAGVACVVGRGGDAAADLEDIVRVDLEAPSVGADAAASAAGGAAADPDRAAYVLYTSGSTGPPKGVLVPHRAVVNRLLWAQRTYPLEADDVVLQSASFGFDFSVWELFAPWLAGACCRIVPAAQRDPASLARLLAAGDVTTAHFVPSVLRAVLDLAPPASGEAGGLRRVFSGGEVLEPALRDRVLERWPGVELYNQYGPTEATIDATWHRCRAGRPAAAVPIGRPIDNLRAYVLDHRLDPVPAEVTGELHLGGAGLARGYAGRPAATAERFVPDPHAQRPGSRLYRTGDLVRQGAGGEIVYAGRADGQVQLHGVRVELGEVEAALRGHPAVADAAAAVRGEGEGRRLLGWVVPRDRPAAAGAGGAAERLGRDVRRHLARTLPPFLVPSRVEVLADLPRTAAGKLDRHALLEADAGAAAATRPPRGPVEALIAGAWEEVLGVAAVGAEDDFFDLGGHSLLAVRVVSRLHRDLGVDLPLRRLFERPTVAALAREVEHLLAAGAGSAPPPLAAADRSLPLPLSFAQERLWFLDRLEPGSTLYNLPAALALDGRLSPAALATALGAVMARHEVLRSRYAEGRRPAQVIDPPSPPALLPLVDLSALAPEVRHRQAERLGREESARPFDLAAGPVVRSALLRLAPECHHLRVTVHHIATDAWSMGRFTEEVAAVYRAAAAGRPSPLEPLPLQYADFAAWQRRWLSGDVLARQLEHWRRRLAGAPPVLELPTDRPRPPLQSYRGASLRLRLDPVLGRRVTAWARRVGATPFMVLLTAFQALLGRFAGTRDVVVGTPVAGRGRVELEPLIGFFVNTLVLRVDLGGTAAEACGFEAAVARVREAVLEALMYGELPFEKLVSELAPERSLAYSPLFQVMFALQTAPAGEAELPGLRVRGLRAESAGAKFDLHLSLTPDGDGFSGSLVYASDLFDATTARRLGAAYRQLLAAALADAGRPVDLLPLLDAAERHQLVHEWSGAGTAASSGAGATVWQRFAARAAARPAAVALVHRPVDGAGAVLTYGELHHRAAALGAHLVDLGVGPEVRVGVMLERGPDLVVALLGVLAAGGAYVPLDPAYPAPRLELMLEDAAVAVLITGEEDGGLPANGSRRVVRRCDGLPGRPPEARHLSAFERAGEGTLAYVIYTSGSTGRPKGVAIEHRSTLALVDWAAGAFTAGELASTLASTSVCFDLSVFEIFVPLLLGHRVVLVGDALDLVASSGEGAAPPDVTLINTVPSAMTELVHLGGVPASVRTVNLAGEPLRASLSGALHALGGVRSVCNLYGPSEDTTYSTWCRVPEDGGEPTIGRAVDGSRVYVVDRRCAPQPVGVPGELLLGGAKLARGYLGRPALTASRWLPDPFAAEPGARLYRTGDRARWLPGGELEFLGRLDGQVKVRGFRIELGEVELALAGHPAVREAAVAVSRGPTGTPQLAAYVVPEAPSAAGEAELRGHLAALLPGHMVPAWWTFLEALPLTPNGKVDRRALPEPQRGGGGGGAPPRNAAEEALAAVWSEVLGVDAPGIHDDFFQSGGDSILSIQVVSRARGRGLVITPRQVFQHPTIAGLAAVARPASTPAAEQGPLTGEVPLAPIQRRFLAAGPIDAHHFNQSVLLAAREAPDVAALAAAVGLLLRHHDALRARFSPAGGVWRQRLEAPGGPPPFHQVDLGALPVARRRQAAAAAAAAAQRSLDLGRGPLLRAVWMAGRRRDRSAGHLLLVVHHLAVDGVSWRLLLDDLAAAYSALAAGSVPELPAKTTSFAAWSRRLEAWAASAEAAVEAERWAASLAAAPPPLPRDLPGDDRRSRVRTVVVRLGPDETEDLLRLPPLAYRCGVEEVLLAALLGAFAASTGTGSLLVDLEGHGREALFDDVDLSRTVGWLTSIHPLLLAAAAGGDAGEALRRVKHSLRSVPHRGVGFGALRHARHPLPELAELPRPQVVFNYLGQLDRVLDAEGPFFAADGPRGVNASPRALREHAFDVTARIAGGRLAVSLRYGGDVHRAATAERLAEAFAGELRRLLDHLRDPRSAGYTPSDFPLAGLDLERLGRLFGGDRGIDDVYPLAPVQEGLLLQALESPAAYVEQGGHGLRGALDVDALAAAWRHLARRHAALRTGFLWQEVDAPLQLVRRDAVLDLRRLDWRGVPPAERDGRLRQLAADDRGRAFDLARPPLVRVTLVELADDAYHLLWTSHHLVTDGWSVAILVRELLQLYDALCRGRAPELPPVGQYRDHLAWLAAQDEREAEAYWRRELGGVREPTPLPWAPPGEVVDGDATANLREVLGAGETAELAAAARRCRVTTGTLVQAAWALLLARYAGSREVVFGATLSGRPADVPGVEGIVGPFINTLPVRVEVPATGRVDLWLRRLQEESAERRQFEHAGLVQRWSGVPLGVPLFETLLVFQNFPAARGGAEVTPVPEVEVGSLQHTLRTRYPLTLVVGPGRRMRLHLAYDRRVVPAAAARRVLAHLRQLLGGLAAGTGGGLEALGPVDAAEDERLDAWGAAAPLAGRPAEAAAVLRDLGAEPRPRLTDDDGRPVAAGVAGEVAFELPPEIDAAVVAAALPVECRVAAGRVCTGWWGRFLADGELRLLGPDGERSVVAGRRVFPRDVEAVIARHPRVRSCAVTTGGGGRWTAWVLPEGTAPAAADLAAFAAERLPAHLRPRRWRIDAALPVDADGALRRDQLGAEEVEEMSGDGLEGVVLDVWRDVLGMPELRADDDFLALGGNSLVAARLAARLRSTLRTEVPLRLLFEAPSPAALAPRLRAALGSGAAVPPLVRRTGGGDAVLSFAQQRLWFHEQLHPQDAVYNVPVALALHGRLDAPALARALAEVMRRHEVLRSGLPQVGGAPVQRVGPPPPARLPCIDLRGVAADSRPVLVRDLALRLAARPFDLEHGPLMRCTRVAEADDHHDLLVTVHHIACDGWSLGILVREVAALYRAFAAGRPSPLPELPLQYGDYARWQRDWLRGEVLAAEVAHWRRRLAGGLGPTALPFDRPRPAPSRRGAQRSWPLDGELSRRIDGLARRREATPYMVLLSGFAVLLHAFGNREDVVVGMPIANRTQAETAGLVGCFVNILPLRLRLDGPPTAVELVERVREASLDALAHQELPLERLVEELPRRGGEPGPPFDVTFGLQNAPREGFSVPGLAARRLELGRQTARFDLTLWVSRHGDGYHVSWTWARDLFEERTVLRMQQRFAAVLDAITGAPEREIDRLAAAADDPRPVPARRLEAQHRKLLTTRPVTIRLQGGAAQGASGDVHPSPASSEERNSR